jgi:DNA primase
MARIPEHLIDRVRESVDIVEIISRYVSLKKHGKNFVAKCPFHTEKTPSFTVSSEKQIFYCFGCRVGGNVYNFLMQYEKISFFEAVQFLADSVGIEIPKYEKITEKESNEYDKEFRTNQFAADFYFNLLKKHINIISPYLKQRNISNDTINQLKIGYVPDVWDALYKEIQSKNLGLKIFLKVGLILQSEKDPARKYDRFRNRLIFPIHNLSGKVIAFGGRSLTTDPNSPKYLNSPESLTYKKSETLYGLFYAKEWIRKEESVIFVEGYMDYIQLYQYGIKNVVATSGTALTEEHAKLIQRYTTNVFLCYDSDTAGIQAALRGGQILFQHNLNAKIINLPQGDDPDSFIQKQGASAFYALLDQAQDYFRYRINKSLELTNGSDIESKTIQVNQLLDSLALLPNPLKRHFYLNSLSAQFKLSEEVLTNELQKKRKFIPKGERTLKEAAEKSTDTPYLVSVLMGAWSAEKDLINLLLTGSNEIKSLIFKYLQSDDFQNEEFKNIFLKIKNSAEKPPDELLHIILSHTENEQIIGLITGNFFEEIKNPIRYLQDCIEKIKLARYRTELDKLRLDLKQLQNTDPEYTDKLVEINNVLLKIQTAHKIFSRS